jgi:asparagine synthase (glutamine-hydrolysing)
MELPDDAESGFEGVWTVPQGSIVTIKGRNRKTCRWYDPLDIPEIRFSRDEDYIAAANAMLAEAVSKVVGLDGTFGIALSGGLDSSIVSDEILRQLPAGRRLKSFTRHPMPEWDGTVAPHKFGDDKPWVEAFAAMHPGLDPSFDDNRGRDFDDRAEHMFMAGDAGYPARMVYARFHGVMDAARRDGCDWLLTADFGNMTFSSSAPWASAEFFRKGKIGQLWQLLANHIDDPRPMWRRMLALGLMPQLPQALQHRIRQWVHSDREVDRFANPFLNRHGRLGEFVREAKIRSNIMTVDRTESRESYIRSNYHSAGLGIESSHCYEQVFGVSLRDVTAYRPLIEFCFGLPTEMFARNGETRWLARQIGKGRMPEAQRTNRLYGEQNVDWHARLKPRLGELRKEVESIRRNAELASLIDTDRMLHPIDTFPDTPPSDPDYVNQLRFFLPAVLYISRYVNWETGNNQV